jgi:hypothetical protein
VVAAGEGTVHGRYLQGLAERAHAAAAPAIGNPGNGQVVGGTVDPLAAAFEEDLAAWLAWLQVERARESDRRAMRRVELVYGTGWVAITGAALAISPLGIAAAVLCVALLVATLLLGYLTTVPGRDTGACCECGLPMLGLEQRARVVRIMNLSRVPWRPVAVRMLLMEVDEALSVEPLSSWPPLRLMRKLLPTNAEDSRGSISWHFPHAPTAE